MRERGLEPPCLAAPVPKTGVATNYTTRACRNQFKLKVENCLFLIGRVSPLKYFYQSCFLGWTLSPEYLEGNRPLQGQYTFWIFYFVLLIKYAQKVFDPYTKMLPAFSWVDKKSTLLLFCPPSRDRTYDRLLKRELLYQLSYGWDKSNK